MQQQLILPEGGLASFLTSNIDEFDDSQLAFGRQSGINSHTDVAERMAALGRNGDTELVHAEKGEIVIHPKLLAENPRLAKEMMDAFTNSDVDLSRYVIGSRSNSINPDTGQAEFFLKKLGRGLKKLVGGIKKIVKKFAPIVVPLALNFITGGAYGAMSLLAQGAISGGITSLVQGGNIKDAMKGALMGGVMGGISAGAQGFMGASGGVSDRFAAGFKGIKGSLQPGQGFILGETANKFSNRGGVGITPPTSGIPDMSFSNDALPKDVTTSQGPPGTLPSDVKSQYNFDGSTADKVQKPSFMSKAKDLLSKKPLSVTDIEIELLKKNPEYWTTKGAAALTEQATKIAAADPGLSWLKTGTAIGGAAIASGAFDPIEPTPLEDPYDEPSHSETRLAKYPERYRSGVAAAPPAVTMQDTMVPANSQMMYQKYLNQQQQPQFAAAGGEMRDFPRRTGYISGSGTETSDDIPAMLSDGEFVMNAKAVRGAGNGSRKEGVRKMYDIMRAFEGGAVA